VVAPRPDRPHCQNRQRSESKPLIRKSRPR